MTWLSKVVSIMVVAHIFDVLNTFSAFFVGFDLNAISLAYQGTHFWLTKWSDSVY